MKTSKFLDEVEKHMYVLWRTRVHIIDVPGNLCCGRSPRVSLDLIPSPDKQEDICSICWKNRPWIK